MIDNSANEDSENWKDPNMPKPKNKKNPYIYFCLERKQSEEKYQGKSLRELVELCNSEWTQMSKFCCVFNLGFRNLFQSSIDYIFQCFIPKIKT